jgi:acetyltransferase
MRLVDGSRVIICPTLPQDAALQQEFFRCLSTEGRFRRFMTRLNELPEALVERFANVDYCSHLALLAEVFEDGHEIMIGEARYVVDANDAEICEFAIAVADDWQAHGIARALLDRLECQAAASGIRRMMADTFITNKAMLRLAAQAGYVVKISYEDGSVARLEKCLSNLPACSTPFTEPRAA